MADINLLQSNHPQKAVEGGAVPNSLNTYGVIIFIIVIILSGGMWYLSANAASQDQNVQTEITQTEQKVISMPNYNAFVTEQESLQGLSFLIQNHLDWSQPALQIAGVTLKGVQYSSITVNQDGTGVLAGSLPSYAALDEYLQALNTKSLSPFIASATLQSASMSQAGPDAGLIGSAPTSSVGALSFTINITFDKSIWGVSAAPAATPAAQ